MYYPLRSLREGNWFKLICGASFQHLPAVRNLALAYTLAGADCIDVAADVAVVAAAREALQVASNLVTEMSLGTFKRQGLPWLMVSLNDGEDPHFRKAQFNPETCPADCPRPCETVCPAQAIAFTPGDDAASGVIDSRCYGCGRCLPICPLQKISTRSYVSTPAAIAPLVLSGVDAVEIHTQVGRWHDFKRLWQAIAPSLEHLKLVAVSCPDGEDLVDYLWALNDLMAPLPCAVVWQTDGRPMSGDIGEGTIHASIRLGQKVLAAGLPGYVQLAGGTNQYTVPKLRAIGLLSPTQPDVEASDDWLPTASPQRQPAAQIAGVAYGSYARVLLSPILDQLERVTGSVGEVPLALSAPVAGYPNTELKAIAPPSCSTLASSSVQLEAVPELLQQAVDVASSLVSQLKAP